MSLVLTPRRGFAFLGIFSIATVAAAVVLTEWLELEPCPLCMFQRLLYLIIGALALVAAAAPRARLAAGALALVAALGGLATAGYQSWMQAFPVLFAECGSGLPDNPIEHLVDWLGRLVPWLFYAWGECTSREWVFLGLSMANWSAVVFAGLSGALIWSLWRARR